MNLEENCLEHHQLRKESLPKNDMYDTPYCHSLVFRFHNKTVILGGGILYKAKRIEVS